MMIIKSFTYKYRIIGNDLSIKDLAQKFQISLDTMEK